MTQRPASRFTVITPLVAEGYNIGTTGNPVSVFKIRLRLTVVGAVAWANFLSEKVTTKGDIMRKFEVIHRSKGTTSTFLDPADARKEAERLSNTGVIWGKWASWLYQECSSQPKHEAFSMCDNVKIITYDKPKQLSVALRDVDQYESAIILIDLLFDCDPESSHGTVCQGLTAMVEEYEEIHFSI